MNNRNAYNTAAPMISPSCRVCIYSRTALYRQEGGEWLRCAASVATHCRSCMRIAQAATANPPTTTGRKLYRMNTTKTANGFSFTVREFTETTEPQPNGQYGLWAAVAHVDGYSTRARATGAGKKSKMSFKRAA